MYIEPNTNIRILHNVPLDTSFDHTIYFNTLNSQVSYFIGKTKYNLNDYTYQRVQRGYARVGIRAENLYDCNYMMYQNTSFGNKWFFAFITAVEYINNEVSEIRFEIDPMQTWFFDYTVDHCFVEREHTVTDVIGEHIEPEPVECGEYVLAGDYRTLINGNDLVTVIAIVDRDQEGGNGNIYDGIYSGAILWVYGSNEVSKIQAKIDEYTQKPDAIISMYMMPKCMIIGEQVPANNRLAYNQHGYQKVVDTIPAIRDGDDLDGYVPRNNKMYTYPYNFFHVDNAAGESLSLRYEFFDNLKPILKGAGCVTQPVRYVVYPCSYKGVRGYEQTLGYQENFNESISLQSYPQCSWNVDAYNAWLSQNTVPIGISFLGMAAGFAFAGPAGAVAGAAVGEIIGAAMMRDTVSTASNSLSQAYSASIAADITKGSLGNSGVNVAQGWQNIYGGRMCVTEQYARVIDDFFTRFGYAVRRNKVPNRNARPHWNYVKTIGCTISGSIPSDDAKAICNIYDQGITFWKNGNEIGNYALDNSPS